MKKLFISLLFLVGCVLTTHAQQDNKGDVLVKGDKIPSFELNRKGERINSANLKGKVVALVFFATWCPPCQKELADIEKTLWPELKDNKQFLLLTVGREHTDEELATYNEKKGFTFPLYPDKDRGVYSLFATQYIPRTYIIGKDGTILYQSSGYTESHLTQMMQLIRQELN